MNLDKDFLKLTESACDIVFICNCLPDFQVDYISPKVQNILGYSDQEVYSDENIPYKLLHPEDYDELIKSVQQNKQPFRKTLRYIHKQGNLVWLDTNYSFIKNTSGVTVGLMGLAKDISNETKKDFESTQDITKINELINSTHGIAKISSKEGRFISVNEKFCERLNYKREELLIKNINDLIFENDALRIFENTFTEKQKFKDKSGNAVYMNVSCSAVPDVYGDYSYYLMIFEDVTKDKIYEDEIINHQKKLESIFNTSGHMIWTVSENIKVTSFNDNFYNSSTSVPRPVHLLDAGANTININNPNYEFWIKKYAAAFAGENQHFEVHSYDGRKHKIWSEVFLSPVFDSSGKVVEVSGIAHNITESKRAESQIIASLREKEILLREIHHRVKNNLQVISSILNLQASFIKDKKTRNNLRECQDRIRSMSYIHEILYRNKDFSNIQFGEYVKTITQNLVSSYGINGKKVNVCFDVEPVPLNLDYSIPCGLILNELVSNALKYAFPKNKKGNIVITFQKKEDKIRFKIADDGVGFPDNLDFKNTETLGLQLVVTLVEQLGGTIDMERKSGTEFLITFTYEIKLSEHTEG